MTLGIDREPNLFDFFHKDVRSAKRDLGAHLSEDSTLYLSQLLAERARADRPAPVEATLAELHGRAAGCPPSDQAQVYRELGDRSLYIAGYFRDHLGQAMVGADYYAAMGSSAYLRVHQVLARFFSGAMASVFHELGEQFQTCIVILDHIRCTHEAHPDLLDRWLRAWVEDGDLQAASRLRERGLLLPKSTGDA